MEAAFGAGPPYTVGVEEEFQLVDPASRALVPAVGAVVEAGNGAGLVTSELSRSCVEMVSPVFETVSDLARELPALPRRAAGGAGGVRGGGGEAAGPAAPGRGDGARRGRRDRRGGDPSLLRTHGAAPRGGRPQPAPGGRDGLGSPDPGHLRPPRPRRRARRGGRHRGRQRPRPAAAAPAGAPP